MYREEQQVNNEYYYFKPSKHACCITEQISGCVSSNPLHIFGTLQWDLDHKLFWGILSAYIIYGHRPEPVIYFIVWATYVFV